MTRAQEVLPNSFTTACQAIRQQSTNPPPRPGRQKTRPTAQTPRRLSSQKKTRTIARNTCRLTPSTHSTGELDSHLSRGVSYPNTESTSLFEKEAFLMMMSPRPNAKSPLQCNPTNEFKPPIFNHTGRHMINKAPPQFPHREIAIPPHQPTKSLSLTAKSPPEPYGAANIAQHS